MLVSYTVGNVLSFKAENTLMFEPGKRLRKFSDNVMEVCVNKDGQTSQLLKNVIIFGSNGSGKSNLLESMDLMRKMVLHPAPKTTDKLPYFPFLLDDESSSHPSKFEVEIISQQQQYRYSFTYNDKEILTEKLEYLQKRHYRTYFERDAGGSYPVLQRGMKYFTKETRPNRLFLDVLQDKNDTLASDVVAWFANRFRFYREDGASDLYHLLEDQAVKEKFLAIMHGAGLRFVDVELEHEQLLDGMLGDEFALLKFLGGEKQKSNQLYTIYHKYDLHGRVIGRQRLAVSSESDGARKFIGLMLAILASEQYHQVLVMDEFDVSLHEEVARAIVMMANANISHSQFIFTTHKLEMMDAKLRKDQIYLIEKGSTGESDSYSIFDFDEGTRCDFGYYKRYLKGEFGALPLVDCDSLVALAQGDFDEK